MSESSVPVPRPSEPLPCPFCGNAGRSTRRNFANRFHDGAHDWLVVCDINGCCSRSGKTEREAIEAWNRRSPSVPTAIQEHVEQLRQLVHGAISHLVAAAPDRPDIREALLEIHAKLPQWASSEEAANSDTERLNFLAQQAAAVMGSGGNGGTAVSVLPVSENAPGIYGYSRLGDGWTEEITKNDVREAIDAAMSAARVQGENRQ